MGIVAFFDYAIVTRSPTVLDFKGQDETAFFKVAGFPEIYNAARADDIVFVCVMVCVDCTIGTHGGTQDFQYTGHGVRFPALAEEFAVEGIRAAFRGVAVDAEIRVHAEALVAVHYFLGIVQYGNGWCLIAVPVLSGRDIGCYSAANGTFSVKQVCYVAVIAVSDCHRRHVDGRARVIELDSLAGGQERSVVQVYAGLRYREGELRRIVRRGLGLDFLPGAALRCSGGS